MVGDGLNQGTVAFRVFGGGLTSSLSFVPLGLQAQLGGPEVWDTRAPERATPQPFLP